MIYIDASRYQNTEHRTGVENYSFFLINQLIKTHARDITLITPCRIELPVQQIIIPFKRLWTQIRLSWEIYHNQKIDNLFVPSHVLPLFHPRRSVITLHDVAFKRFPESYPLWSRWYLQWSTRFALRHAHKIIVPSQATRADLIDFYGAPAKKIIVIPHGHEMQKQPISEDQAQRVLQKYQLEKNKFLLYIGRIELKKNLLVLIRAFQKIVQEYPGIQLALAGKDGHGAKVIRAAADKERNIRFTGYTDEIEKAALLKNALAFVYPSLCEGFGLPLLEAMAYNLPIIASAIPAAHEVAKQTAVFFAPQDADTLTKKIKKVIENNPKKGRITAQQQAILKTYTWEACAAATWETLTKN